MTENRQDALQRYLESQSDGHAAQALRSDMVSDPVLRHEIDRWRRLAAVVNEDGERTKAAAALPPVAGLLEALHAAAATGGAGSALASAGSAFGPILAAAIIVGAIGVGVIATRFSGGEAEPDQSTSLLDSDSEAAAAQRPTPIARSSSKVGLESRRNTDGGFGGSKTGGQAASDAAAGAAANGTGSTTRTSAPVIAFAPPAEIAAPLLNPSSGTPIGSAGGPADPELGSPGGSGAAPSPTPTSGSGGPPTDPIEPSPSETAFPAPPTATPTIGPPSSAESGVAGTVVRRDGRSIDGLEITLWAHRDGSSETISIATILDAGGGYSMPLSVGSWWVRVDPNDARPAWAGSGGGALSPIGSAPIVVEPATYMSGIDIVLDSLPGSIARGLVLRAGGGPAGHILVSAQAGGTGPWQSALTGADGVFELPLAPGAYTLGVSDSLSGPPVWWLGAAGALGSAPTVLDISALDGVTLTIR